MGGTAADRLIFISFFEQIREEVFKHLFDDIYEPFPDFFDEGEQNCKTNFFEKLFQYYVGKHINGMYCHSLALSFR